MVLLETPCAEAKMSEDSSIPEMSGADWEGSEVSHEAGKPVLVNNSTEVSTNVNKIHT